MSNEEELKNQLIQYLRHCSIEIPKEAALIEIIKTAKTLKEKAIFDEINQNLTLDDKEYIAIH